MSQISLRAPVARRKRPLALQAEPGHGLVREARRSCGSCLAGSRRFPRRLLETPKCSDGAFYQGGPAAARITVGCAPSYGALLRLLVGRWPMPIYLLRRHRRQGRRNFRGPSRTPAGRPRPAGAGEPGLLRIAPGPCQRRNLKLLRPLEAERML